MKKRAPLNSRSARRAARKPVLPAHGTVAEDRSLADNVRAAAKMFNEALSQAKRAGLSVVEGLDTTTEASEAQIEAGPIKIVSVTRVL